MLLQICRRLLRLQNVVLRIIIFQIQIKLLILIVTLLIIAIPASSLPAAAYILHLPKSTSGSIIDPITATALTTQRSTAIASKLRVSMTLHLFFLGKARLLGLWDWEFCVSVLDALGALSVFLERWGRSICDWDISDVIELLLLLFR